MILICVLIYWLATLVAFTTPEVIKPYLLIEPLTSRDFGPYLVSRLHDQLNLTCTVVDNSTDIGTTYNVTWSIPRSPSKYPNNIIIQQHGNSANIFIPQLETIDEGLYECNALRLDRNIDPLTSTVVVNIKYRKECGDAMFTCSMSSLQNCIPRRFRCDGYPDCQMGEDEDRDMCGGEPCAHKLPCEDQHTSVVRCIPQSWCCNVRLDPNCTVREPLSCCSLIFHHNFMEERGYYGPHKPHYTDMSILQPAIYAIIGCVVVFMVVVTVLVIAIYRVRVYMRVQYPPASLRQESAEHSQNLPLHDLDVFYNRGCGVESCPPGLLVTYNINNGVQIMGIADQPPPYSEIMLVPPKEGPPPPYSSLPESEALLQRPATPRSHREGDQRQDRGVLSSDLS